MRARFFAALALLAAMALPACTTTPIPARFADGTSLPRRAWLPEGPPQAVILAVHGFNDYSNAFTEFGEFAAERGVAVHAYDQRGFGANPAAGHSCSGQRTIDYRGMDFKEVEDEEACLA